ncbi:MAG: hypothetical protein HZC28_10270 [Spirochaetes bacterium]|nr:hypothetical protein [Spirochaetota bacterium]
MRVTVVIAALTAICCYGIDVQLKLVSRCSYVEISHPRGITVQDASGNSNKKEKIRCSRTDSSAAVMMFPGDEAVPMTVRTERSCRTYFGSISVAVSNRTLYVNNKISEERYLSSVVGSEMGHASREALRAQAIASRTLIAYIEQHSDERSLGELDGEHQVYGGAITDTPASRSAVADTAGMIMTYNGRLFYPFMHSTSCGVVFPPSTALGLSGDDYPAHINPFPDDVHGEPLSGRSPYFAWTRQVPYASLKSVFNLPADAVAVTSAVHRFGYVTDFFIIDRTGAQHTVPGYRFRSLLERSGIEGVRSVFCSVSNTRAVVVISGRGFGHLAGMPQWSAKRLAEMGFSYREILERYYPGAVITAQRGIR